MNRKVTLFVIADQLDQPLFVEAVNDLIHTGRCTIGVHGMTHRCWSAYPPDPNTFTEEIGRAMVELGDLFGDSFRPWFRAPAGYIAPWMAKPLAELGFTVDSSINPSPLLGLFKSGGSGWNRVQYAISESGIVERPWRTTGRGLFKLPTCGPAQHIPLLKYIARRSWRKLSYIPDACESEIEDSSIQLDTVYWHAKDHVRYSTHWYPPLSVSPDTSNRLD